MKNNKTFSPFFVSLKSKIARLRQLLNRFLTWTFSLFKKAPPEEPLDNEPFDNEPFDSTPVTVRIEDNRQIYRIKCLSNETVHGILKKFHEARRSPYEQGTLHPFCKRDEKGFETDKIVDELYLGQKMHSLDNRKALSKQNIAAGSSVYVHYQPKQK